MFLLLIKSLSNIKVIQILKLYQKSFFIAFLNQKETLYTGIMLFHYTSIYYLLKLK